jgi:hypothetical protein
VDVTYGIDGVFVSRFVGETANPERARHVKTVLASIREGCHCEGCVWAMMLDLSMGRRATTVLLWGLGFKDRHWTPAQGAELVDRRHQSLGCRSLS